MCAGSVNVTLNTGTYHLGYQTQSSKYLVYHARVLGLLASPEIIIFLSLLFDHHE